MGSFVFVSLCFSHSKANEQAQSGWAVQFCRDPLLGGFLFAGGT